MADRFPHREYCKTCGARIKDGKHTEYFQTSWVRNGKSIRPTFYRTWDSMKSRCYNPKSQRYHTHGGRGIRVCDEWLEYAEFRKWAISSGYRAGLQIDRIDNDGDYTPDNCRWATLQQQLQNRRLPGRAKHGRRYNARELTEEDVYAIRDSSKSQTELGRIYKIHPSTIGNIQKRKAWAHLPERNNDSV